MDLLSGNPQGLPQTALEAPPVVTQELLRGQSHQLQRETRVQRPLVRCPHVDSDPRPHAELAVGHADVQGVGALLQVPARPDSTVGGIDGERPPSRVLRDQVVAQDVLQVLVGGVQPADDPAAQRASGGGDEDLQSHHRGGVLAPLGHVDVDHTDGGQGGVAAVCHLIGQRKLEPEGAGGPALKQVLRCEPTWIFSWWRASTFFLRGAASDSRPP